LVPESRRLIPLQRSTLLIILSFYFILFLSGGEASELDVDFTGDDSQREISAAVGDIVFVTLPLDSFYGRGWSLQHKKLYSNVELIEDPIFISKNPRPGAATAMEFRFKVTGFGSTQLHFSPPNDDMRRQPVILDINVQQ
jgi:hypothetical protein